MRLGTRYRLHSFRAARLEWEQSSLPSLDVGCFDGEFLATFGGGFRIGVDLQPQPAAEGVSFVQADGRRLPFRSCAFGQTFAFDVIEHVPDGASLYHELVRVTAGGGRLMVTTPSARIRLFPPFLTRWISARWGHIYRLGYSAEGLLAMSQTGPRLHTVVESWSAPLYRFCYLLLRAMDELWSSGVNLLVAWVARWDARHRKGDRGFYWVTCRREECDSE